RLAFHLVRLPLAAACVLAPCFFMGTTFPLLCRAFLDRPRLPSSLYAWNTLGACLAVLLCEFVLVRRWGTDTMLWVVLGLNVLLGLWFLIAGGRLLERFKLEPSEIGPVSDRARRSGGPRLPIQALFLGATLSGFLSGALEADAFRRVHFAQIYNGSAMAFVSFWAIAAIFVSSWLVHRLPALRLVHVK